MPVGAVLQAKLNRINSKTFPIPQGSLSAETTATDTKSEANEVMTGRLVNGSNMLKFHLRPASRVNHVETSAEPAYNVSNIQKQLEQGKDQAHAAAVVQASWSPFRTAHVLSVVVQHHVHNCNDALLETVHLASMLGGQEIVANMTLRCKCIETVFPAEMPEVLEAARRAEGDASCSSQQVPDCIQQVS